MPGQKFPKYPLEDALIVAQAAHQQGKACKLTTLAAALNYTPKTGAFKQKKAAAAWFGLIEVRDDDTVLATELAKRIISPLNDAEHQRALAQAFLDYDLFNELYNHIPTGVDLPAQRIANIAERECGIEVDNKEAFVKVFAQSGEFAGVLTKKSEDCSVLFKPRDGGALELAPSTSDRNPLQSDEAPVVGQPASSIDSQGQQTRPNISIGSHFRATGLSAGGVNVTLNIAANTPVEVVQLILDRILPDRKETR